MVLGKGRLGTTPAFRMCIQVHIKVLSHMGPNKRHSHPSSTSQTLHRLPHDSAASSSPVLRLQIEAARHDEPRVMGDMHARCSYPDGPVFSREGY